MTTDTVPQTVLFPDLFDKPLFARFNQEQASSDGGAILLKAAERIYGLVKAFAGCLFDKRAPDKTRHSLADLIGQRIFGIACGHPDCNDGDRLAEDPIHKLLLDRDPVSGERLASQPTLSRFENAVNGCALYRMADELATRVIERHRRRLDGRARCITIDLDPTDDPTHGAQQYTLFNGYYDNWCYLPLLGFLTFDRESEQYLCAALLRHGKAVASEGTVGLLSRLLPRLRRAFPRARILVRLDGGFASPAVFAFLEAQPRLDYVVAMAKNAVLERYAEPAMLVARARTWRSEQTEHVYTETNEYQAGTWNHARRVVIKAEVVRHRDRVNYFCRSTTIIFAGALAVTPEAPGQRRQPPVPTDPDRKPARATPRSRTRRGTAATRPATPGTVPAIPGASAPRRPTAVPRPPVCWPAVPDPGFAGLPSLPVTCLPLRVRQRHRQYCTVT